MIGVLVWEVFIRYVDRPTLWAVDIATMTYGAHFFLAGALTLCMGKHIRTDFFYGKWSRRRPRPGSTRSATAPLPPRDGDVRLAELGFLRESWDPRKS